MIAEQELPTCEQLGNTIKQHQVTTAWLTASLFNAMIDDSPEIFRPLQQLLTGGEALSVHHVCLAIKALPDTRIINGYGPTESTTFATTFTIPSDFSPQRASVPIGKPLSNTWVRILDRRDEPAPQGIPGELMIGGDGLAFGYRNDASLTSQKFFDWRGERLYRSGDRCRWLADGTIEFLGRLDNQIKLRGFRISPLEVENAMKTVAGVERALVIADNGRLFGFYTGAIPENELRSALNNQLPKHMLPARLAMVRAFALTPNAKVIATPCSRKWLPSLALAALKATDF